MPKTPCKVLFGRKLNKSEKCKFANAKLFSTPLVCLSSTDPPKPFEYMSQEKCIFCYRYNAIIRPLKPRMGRPMTILVAVLIWVVGMVIALPQLLYFTTEIYDVDKIMCFPVWPDGRMNESTAEFV